MGRLNKLVQQAIESRVRFLSRGATTSGLFRRYHAVAPLLSSDFVLEFSPKDSSVVYRSDDFLLTDLNGLDSQGLSWAPDTFDGLVPQPTVGASYFTIQFFVSGEMTDSPQSFPTLWFYENQFTLGGVLRLPNGPEGDSLSARVSDWKRLGREEYAEKTNNGDLDLGFKIDDYAWSSKWVRPNIRLLLVYAPNPDTGVRDELVLCSFNKCVFGTPHSSFNVGQTAGMVWSQQIGFSTVTWGNVIGGGGDGGMTGGTFFERANRRMAPVGGSTTIKPY